MDVSVVVPVLDERHHIEALVEHVRTRVPAAELVVVDGGSGDGTPELARAAGADRVLVQEGGRGPQLRAGAAAARAPVLWFLHADTRLPHDALAHLERALVDPAVVAGAFRTWHRPEGDCSPLLARLLHLADLRSRVTRLPYGDQALFVRADAYAAVGGFPPVPLMEDLALARRLWALGRVVTVPARVEVSGRRFQARPVVFTAAVNLFPLLWRAGMSEERLAGLYRHVR